jgi:hypothetical protein
MASAVACNSESSIVTDPLSLLLGDVPCNVDVVKMRPESLRIKGRTVESREGQLFAGALPDVCAVSRLEPSKYFEGSDSP